MRLIIREDYEAVSSWVAAYIHRRITDFAPTADRPFVLGLPTGSSPIGVYKRLVRYHKQEGLSFQNVITFNMDEYVGLPRDHPESYHSFMWKHLFSHIDIKPENVHILNGNAPDLQGECDKYEELIEGLGGIELFLAGIGTDGHIAFNEPGSSLTSRTRVKTLARDTIEANKRFFQDDVHQVPTKALTVGVGTVMDAHEVLVIVSGASKAAALSKCIEGGVHHMYPLSALQSHRRACIVCDEQATNELRVKTARYFKGLEEVHMQLLGDTPMLGYERGMSRTFSGAAPAAAPAPAPM